MIINYFIRNFYSVGEEGATINFAVDGNAPKNNLFINKGEAAGRLSLVEAVIGPNASGKTRVLQGLAFLRHMITYSYYNSPTESILFRSHYGEDDRVSEASVKFIVKKRVFEYSFVFESKKIIEEELKEYSRTKERITAKTLASRKWNPKSKNYDFSGKELGLSNLAELRQNASMVSSAMQKDLPTDLAKLITDYWVKNVSIFNLWYRGNKEDLSYSTEMFLRASLDSLHEKKNDSIMLKAKEILSKFDLGFNDFFRQELESSISPDDKKVVYGIKHKFKDKEFTTGINLESSGTKRMIIILDNILNALAAKGGGVAIIDEIDAFLHPDIVEAFVELFMNPETNPNKAQLLFSTHNHRILNSLDSRQIILVEKNAHGKTEAWRLDEMEGVKSTDNYYTRYITGAYGARPRINM